jgi:hypothetical protein
MATGLVMTPAAYHRPVEPGTISERFVSLPTRLLLRAMITLAVGLSLDFFAVASAVLHDLTVGIALGVSPFAVFLGFWFVLPLWWRPDSSDSTCSFSGHQRERAPRGIRGRVSSSPRVARPCPRSHLRYTGSRSS